MQTWISNQTLFPNLNQELLQEILNFKDADKEKIARFAIKYNLSYLGEIAERWQERNIVHNSYDLRSLILGLVLVSRDNYLYDQEVLFVSSVRQYLSIEWDSLAAAALLNFTWAKFKDPIEARDIFEKIQKEDTSSLSPNDRVLLISLLSDILLYTKYEGLLEFVIKQIETLELNLTGSHENYPLVVLLSDAYVRLGKPSSKLFKNKTKAKWLRTLYLLTTKEMPTNTNEHETLGITKEEFFSYNYLLSNIETIGKSSYTGPGLIRMKRRYLESHFWSKVPLPEQVLDQVQQMKKDDLDYLLNLGFVDNKNNPRFSNENNLKIFIGLVEGKLLARCNPSYILLIKRKILTKELASRIIEKLLMDVYFAQNKTDFKYLENLRSNRKIECAHVSNSYVKALLDYGFISPDEIDILERRQLVSSCIIVLLQDDRITDLLGLLSECKTHHLKVLLLHLKLDKLLTLIEDPSNRKLLYYYLQAHYHFNPKYYVTTIYQILNQDKLRSLNLFSDEQHHQLEKDLIGSTLLDESSQNTLVRKHMTDQQRAEADLESFCQEIQSTRLYSMECLLIENKESFKTTKKLRAVFLERLMSLKTEKHQLSTLILNYQLIRVMNICEEEEYAAFEQWLTKKMFDQYEIAI